MSARLDPTKDPSASAEVEYEDLADEASPDAFDRVAFAMEALDRVRPRRMTVAVCEGVRRVHVEAGRAWGGAPDERWAILFVPRTASRRAISLAVAGLGGTRPAPYQLDVLLRDDR